MTALLCGELDLDVVGSWGKPLGLSGFERHLATEWERLSGADTDGHLIDDIWAIRQRLQLDNNPIDYARRRHAYPEPATLADRVVRPVAQELDTPLTRALVLTVSLYVYEQLSGNDALLSARGLNLPGVFRMRFRRTRASWSRHPVFAIDRIVEAALLRHRIDEPLRWQPEKVRDIWVSPAPVYDRTLPGWANRDLRTTSRIQTPSQLAHLTLEQVVAFACGQGRDHRYAQRIRRLLIALERSYPPLDGLPPTVRPGRAADALTELSRHTGRELFTPPTPTTETPSLLTADGIELIEIAEAHRGPTSQQHDRQFFDRSHLQSKPTDDEVRANPTDK